MHAAKSFLVEADAPVILAQNGLDSPVGPSNETNVIRGGIEVLSAYYNVRPFWPRVALEPENRVAVFVYFDRISERLKRRSK